jgi:D-alanyl-D-alanine dipeptidase
MLKYCPNTLIQWKINSSYFRKSLLQGLITYFQLLLKKVWLFGLKLIPHQRLVQLQDVNIAAVSLKQVSLRNSWSKLITTSLTVCFISTFMTVFVGCKNSEAVTLTSFTAPMTTLAQTTSDSEVVPSQSFATSSQSLTTSPLPFDARLVDIRSVNTKIALDIRYATTNNFLKGKVYPVARCVLRGAAARRLSQVQDDLATSGLGLKVYDCYRPLSVQKQMWKIKPDPRYVANPATGSRHNRGAAVDITLVDRNGKELEMPTGFDDFTEKAHRNYKGTTAQAKKNSKLLEDAMKKYGFIPLATEWWHFDAPGWDKFSILDVGFGEIPS